MRYFVVSDIHGHFYELMDALNNSDWNVVNNNHQLIVNGDLFDRGSQSKEVLEYLYPLWKEEKVIIIKGNHEIFLEEFINGNKKRVEFNCRHNGLNETLISLIPDFNQLTFEQSQEKLKLTYPYLEDFLNALPYYYETEHYVITHAGLDFSQGDFKKGNLEEAVWYAPEEFFQIDLEKEYHFTKKVVVGHRFTCLLRRYFNNDYRDDFSIYYHPDNQKIAIDGGCYYSKQINVFEFEEKN